MISTTLIEHGKIFKGLKISYFCLRPFRCKGQPHASGMIPEDISGCLRRPSVNWLPFFHISHKSGFPPVLTASSSMEFLCRQQSVRIMSHNVSLLCWNACFKSSKLGNALHLILPKARLECSRYSQYY